MINRFQNFLIVIVIATAFLVLALALYRGQLTFGTACILAGLIIALSVLATSNARSGVTASETGFQDDAMGADGAPSGEDVSHRISPELLAMLNHELRTPMNVLLGVADLMRLTDLTHKQMGYLRVIQGSGDSLLTLLENFLDLSELEADAIKLQKQEFDIVELLDRVLRAMGYQAYGQGVELLVDVPVDSSIRASGDPHRLRQALVNLIGNRIRFGEGEIVVQVSIAVAPGNRLTLHVSVIDLYDNSTNVFEESLSDPGKILELGTDDMRQGSKIGLAVCQRLVENMGGKIGVARTADNGTRAWISVPLAESELLPGTQATNQNGLKGQSAIVISGNRTLDRIIRRYLEAWGMSCAIAADISSASTLLRKDHERKFSVAIVDTNLIESSGPLITSQIQERVALADLPLVLLRTITEALETDSAPSSDKVRFVTKPLLPREFRNSLLKIIGSESIRTEHKEESGRLRILIAEDNTANGHMLIAMLRSLGCDPDYVENGREALEILAREPYDLVLMDFEMPGLDGDQVTREVRTNRGLYASQPVIIAVTATNSVEHRRRCLDAGMDGFIAKPIRLEKLKQGLLEWPLLAKVDQVSDVDNSGQITAGTDVPEFRLTEQLYRRIGQGSPEIRHNYIDLFLGDSLKRIEDLHLALRSKDTEVLSRQSHALKGACLEIGHLRMSQHCDHLRAASEQGRLDDAAVVVDEIDKEFTQLRNILEAEKMKDNQDTANPAR